MINPHPIYRPALLVLYSLFSGALAACVAKERPTLHAAEATRYVCEGGTGFAVLLDGGAATVRFADGDYRLERRRSSLGARFSSETATLIVDGDMAVFVAEDRLNLNDCASTAHIARNAGRGG